MKNTVTLAVARGTAESGMTLQKFEVPFTEGMSVLDALLWIRTHEDASLAVRYSCLNANACKECSMSINGETVYACTYRLAMEGATVEPAKDKSVLRDLVTDIVPSKEHLTAARGPAR